MDLLLDNTAVQSAGLALTGLARRESSDAEELLQLASLLVFSERLIIGGYESDTIAEQTETVRSRLHSLGVSPKALKCPPLFREEFIAACTRAALQCARDVESAFVPQSHPPSVDSGIYPVSLGADSHAHRLEALRRVLEPAATMRHLHEIGEEALERRKTGAVVYMLTSHQELRQALLRRLFGLRRSRHLMEEVDLFCRSYLNDALALEAQARYSPSVVRARRLRRETDFLTSRLGRMLAETAGRLRGQPLEVPPLSAYLLRSSRGVPERLIEQSVSLRERMVSLRAWLTSRLPDARSGEEMCWVELDERVRELQEVVVAELGFKAKPTLLGALEVIFVLGVPTAKLSGAKLAEWVSHRWRRRRVRVLTEVSKTVAFLPDVAGDLRRYLAESGKFSDRNSTRRRSRGTN